MGAELLLETIPLLETGTAQRIPQPEDGGAYASQLTKEMAWIDWNRPAQEIHNLVRGMNPWPIAQTEFRGKRLKLFRVSCKEAPCAIPGKAWEEDGAFFVGCGKGTAVCLEEVQYEGGKRMSGNVFLRGHAPAGRGNSGNFLTKKVQWYEVK